MDMTGIQATRQPVFCLGIFFILSLSGCGGASQTPTPSPAAQIGFAFTEADARCNRLKAELAISKNSPDEPLLAEQVQRWCGRKIEILNAIRAGSF